MFKDIEEISIIRWRCLVPIRSNICDGMSQAAEQAITATSVSGV